MPYALVTGASSGIGASITRRLIREGWTVYGAARRVDRLETLQREGARVLELDVTEDASMAAAVERMLAECGRIDALVNNAGYGSYGAIEDVPMEEARRQFEVNVFGLARMAQLVLPTMRAQRSGRIVNISSMGGRIYTPMGGWYHATKHAVEALSDAMRLEVKPFGVQVVVIQPGAIASEWVDHARTTLERTSGSGPYAAFARAMARMLVAAYRPGRAGSPEAVAKLVSRALRARHPRARYAGPTDARALLIARKYLPDAVFSALVERAFRSGVEDPGPDRDR